MFAGEPTEQPQPKLLFLPPGYGIWDMGDGGGRISEEGIIPGTRTYR